MPSVCRNTLKKKNNSRSKAGKVSSQINHSIDSSPIEHKSCIDFWCQSKVQIGCKIDRHQKNWEEIYEKKVHCVEEEALEKV